MASRQEEKEQRRLEREQAEAKERAAAARRKRMNMVLGGLIGLLVIAGAAFAIVSAAGGGDDEGEPGGSPDEEEVAKLPEQKTQDLDEAVKLAGCKLEHPKYEGAGHEEKDFTAADYKTNPPTSGAHFPQWYEDGIYEAGNVDNLGMLVHTLEHGRVNVQYKPGTPANVIDILEAFFVEKSEYHMLVYENTTNMEPQIAATAWDQLLGCNAVNDKTWDALRTFRDRYLDKAPEKVP